MYFLYNGLTLLHKYTSARASDGVHQSVWLMRVSSCLGYTLAGRVVSCTVLVRCVSSLEIPLASGGRPPQALALFREYIKQYCGISWSIWENWRLRCSSLGECWQGPRHFWKCQVHVGYSPAPRPILKRFCAILVRLVGRKTNNSSPISVT